MTKLNERMEAGTDAAIPTNVQVNNVSQTIAKPNVVRWPDDVRLAMIEKSEFYNNPTVYQYGYYDGYQKRNEDIAKAVELIQKVRSGYLNPDSMLQNAIILLIG